MKISAILLVSFLSSVSAAGSGFLRGEAAEKPLDQLACTFKGGSSQDTCDATKSEDGSTCVWCSLAAYGVCVSEAVAAQMKQAIPGVDCDDDGSTDDDTATDDDKAPDDEDDDVAPSDDSVPDDYWTCLENNASTKECTAAGCAWCDNKGGYGVCMDKDLAKTFDDSDWYSCTMPSLEEIGSDSLSLNDPSDPTCIAATIGGDESTCKGTKDMDGKACEWCSFQGFEFCLNDDQAELAEQYGASCNESLLEESEIESKDVSDPSDPTCIVVTINGDESTCKGTKDMEGKACDWCSFQGFEFCLNGDQAQIAEQYGASCDSSLVEDNAAPVIATNDLSDPSDPTCIAATIGGDESSCKEAMDADGKPCDWCSFQGFEFCVNVDQAAIAEQYGASCNDKDGIEYETAEISDPSDPTCIAATIGGDESTCKDTKDMEGKACDWCSFQGFEFCLNDDQAQIAEQYGASCGDRDQEAENISASIA